MATELFKVLSDHTRLRILVLLYHQDLCVCEMVELLHESQPKISKHMAKIRSANLVSTKRNEQFIYYSLNQEHNMLITTLDALLPTLSQTEPFMMDLQKLSQMDEFVCTRDA